MALLSMRQEVLSENRRKIIIMESITCCDMKYQKVECVNFHKCLQEFKQPEVNEYGPRDSSVMPTTGCDKESDNSKENTDDSLKQQQKTDSSSVKSPLKCDVKAHSSEHSHLSDFKDFDRGYVTFGGGAYGGRITGKDVRQKNYVLFTDSEFPKDGLTCLVAKATSEESMLWHRRLGHVNFKNINKLVKENLVRDLPLKRFENDQTCVACLKGKQHRASCKTKAFSPITKPLFMLHMDLFGPTFVSSLMHKKYCLVVTDDYSRFSWVFFLRSKDETSEILKNFIKEVENLVDKKVKIIRSDNGTEFKNKVMDREKGIKRKYSVARTPQQNGKLFLLLAMYKIRSKKGSDEFSTAGAKKDQEVQKKILMKKSPEKMKSAEKMEEEDVATQKEMKEVSKETGAKRKKSIPRKSTRKRQKMEEDAEKEELKGFLDIIPREEVPIEVESLYTKFPVVDWKTCVLTENFMYYQVFRGDGSSKNYKVLSEMLEDFDRQDVEELYRLVKKKYSASRLEGFDLMLWGDLYTLFESDEEDEIWKNQHEYNLISWRLCDFCGIHILYRKMG
ncbi:putative ribonuclease H-like domain-containing protein [Tanacetum coccineum]